MKTLDFILDKYKVRGQKPPIGLWCSRKITLPRLFNQLGFLVGVEVGVAGGHNAVNICTGAPLVKLYAIDAWKPYFGCTHGETDATFEKVFKTAKWRMKPFKIEIIRKWSKDAVKQFDDSSLDFVHIDAAHDYKSVTEDIKMWSKKVRVGGIISGHDYTGPIADRKLGYYKEIYDVKHAVDDWVKKKKIKPLFVLNKTNGQDPVPSWFWVKGKNG
jgi:predicted O-methyltransferase YrrM